VADIVGLPDSAFIQPVDGVSLKPLFQGETGPRERPLGFRFGTKTAYVDNRYKLVTDNLNKGEFELYDLESDPHEEKDLRAEKPDLYVEMKKAWQAWNDSVDASFAGKDYPEGKVTPPDPESISWHESPLYQPYLKELMEYNEFRTYIERGGRSAKKRSKADKGAKMKK
jgi:arylsulfatase A-like enzyme